MLVPADAQLKVARDLHVQQAALTGEPMPVEKNVANGASAELLSKTMTPENPADSLDRVFVGSSVVSGRAEAIVTATGARIAFGGIVGSLSRRAPETEFERGMKSFSLFIVQIVFFLTLFVLAVNVLHKRDPLESLLFAVALAVGLTPEFLPMITTITLSGGASRMARQKVIVKNLSSIQNFGQMDTLCSDKTGTLTGGVMTLTARLGPLGAPSETAFLYAYLNSLFETGVTTRSTPRFSRPRPSRLKARTRSTWRFCTPTLPTCAALPSSMRFHSISSGAAPRWWWPGVRTT